MESEIYFDYLDLRSTTLDKFSFAPASPCTALEALLLTIMVPFAQGLPVAPIPEQYRIAAMGNDMIDDSGERGDTLRPAHAAERVLSQEQAPRLVPPPIIAAFSSATPLRVGRPVTSTLAFLGCGSMA
jgi:hypothetical protein